MTPASVDLDFVDGPYFAGVDRAAAERLCAELPGVHYGDTWVIHDPDRMHWPGSDSAYWHELFARERAS